MAKIIGTRGINGGLQSGIAYVYIPADVDRNQFISDCFNTGTVSILTPDGQRFDNIYVNINIFQYLNFPGSSEDLGSLVFYVKIQKQNLPIIVAIINKKGEVLGFQNGQFRVLKNVGNNIIDIIGDANKGNLFINVQSDEQGNIIINAKNKNKFNKIKINVDGNIETTSNNFNSVILEQFLINVKNNLDEKDKETIIKYVRKTGLTYQDEFNNKILITESGFSYEDSNKNKVTITKDGLIYQNDKGTLEVDKNGKFSFKNDQYSLIDLMTDLIKEIEAIKTPTSIGLNQPINVANFALIRTQKLSKILK